MLTAVIGDVHANARALAAALALTDRQGFDLRVLSGDLLTYGVDVAETLDLVGHATATPQTVLLRGNHDQGYDTMLTGGQPDITGWVRRHLDWTMDRLPVALWRSMPFVDSHAAEGVYFAHANPFRTGDWSYLNGEADHARAAAALEQGGWRAGVFGHTHRPRLYDAALGAFIAPDTDGGALASTAVANAGSIGQPRGAAPREVVLWIEVRPAETRFRFEPLRYDVAAHCRDLWASSLPTDLRDRCLGYHPASEPAATSSS